MRLLTVIAGLLVCGTGAFCFAFYTSTFADVAFLVGTVMMISGTGNCVAYLVSGAKRRLTETTLVEGMVTLLYGFAVLSNQVTESMLTMFFGTWLTLCGVTRFSQSLYVSRFNTRDWAKIIPLSAIATMLGVIMMLPWLVATVMPLMLVGGAFLLDGMSMILFAMYMKDTGAEMAKGEAEAHARAEAKKAKRAADRQEQDRLRSLSNEERAKEEAERRAREHKEAQERREKREAERQARKEGKSASRTTVRLNDDEVEEIKRLAPSDQSIQKQETEEFVSESKAGSLEFDARLHWNKPESIPTLRESRPVEKKPEPEKNEVPKLSAVNLEEIENEIPIIQFEEVELPKVDFISDRQTATREEVLKNLDEIEIKKDLKHTYPTLNLEELAAEPLQKKTSPSDATRFTQKLDFSWIEKVNEEIKKKESI